jgi:hypothetical protein
LPPSVTQALHRIHGGLGTEVDFTTVAAALGPVAKELFADDATTDVETLKARIANHRRTRDSFSKGTVIWTLYNNKVNVLKARLKASLVKQREQAEDRASSKQWASLGKSTVVVGLVIGGALTAFLVSATGAVHRSGGRRSSRSTS